MSELRERMGSGGPRGLQILQLDASGAQGGFDSHAFPPVHRLVLLLLALACAWTGAAAAAAPDSTARSAPAVAHPAAAPADTLVRAAEPDTEVAAHPHQRWSEQPRFVMLRSLAIPGWGQWHNHARVKAVVVAGVEGWLVGGILSDQRALARLLKNVDAAQRSGDADAYAHAASEYNNRLDSFVGGQWLLAGVLAYTMVDAYVDAHFRTFEIDFRNDPALPPGSAPDTPEPGGDRPARSARLSLRWHF